MIILPHTAFREAGFKLSPILRVFRTVTLPTIKDKAYCSTTSILYCVGMDLSPVLCPSIYTAIAKGKLMLQDSIRILEA